MLRLSTFIKSSGALKPIIVSRSAATASANVIQHAQHGPFVLTPNDFTKEGNLKPGYYSIAPTF